MTRRFVLLIALVLGPLAAGSLSQDTKPGVPPSGPLSPREEQATFRVLDGFTIDLVAAEPDVIDPVALAFDENGRLFVAEMHAYPNEGVGTGIVTSGKIKMLEDTDGDGVFEKMTLFADNLRLPNCVMPYRNGLLVSNAPELIFLEDTDGDGKADKKRVLYSGFDLSNIQQMLNGLQWGLDNWVYGLAGAKGGDIKSAENPDAAVISLRGRGIRFKPDIPASLEPTSGGGQFGLTPDNWFNWFTATNSQHLRQIVLPEHYLRRNPDLPVTAVTLDIPDHGAACKVHRLSPFESWRVERTTQRKGGPLGKVLPPNELVPGGFVTSGCSPLVYTADLLPKKYHGNSFVCDPANNLIHRDALEPRGATFVAQRADESCEFLASTHTWFRPVYLCQGPDGAIYVADFYREIIETPLSLPEDIKKRWDLSSRKRGRIWRVRPEGQYRPARPNLGKASSADLVKHLANPNLWWRISAQRLLVERQDKSVVPALEKLAGDSKFLPGTVHALWTLRGLDSFHPKLAIGLSQNSAPFARAQALKLVEPWLKAAPTAGDPSFDMAPFRALAEDPSPIVRFQAAFSLHDFPGSLYKILRQDAGDRWVQTAVLSSINTPSKAAAQLALFAADVDKFGKLTAGHQQLIKTLGFLVGARGKDQDLSVVFYVLPRLQQEPALQASLLGGFGQGLQNQNLTIASLQQKPAFAKMRAWHELLDSMAKTARDENKPLAERQDAVAILGYGPFELASTELPQLLTPQQPQPLQLAAIRALAQHQDARVAPLLLASWSGFSPGVRREVLEAIIARPERVATLLDYIETKKVQPGQLEPARLDQLRKHPSAKLRARAQKLLVGQIAPARQKVVASYQGALEMKGDAGRGKDFFKKICAACHRLENVGVEVGADLQSVLSNKTPERLLIDILDPSREVDPRYIEYIVTTAAGKVVTGLIAAETAGSITLRRAEKTEDTLLRSQIDSIQATSKSLMPEGLEMQLQRQDLADLIAYLTLQGRKK